MIQAVIFDCDGTLVDSEGAHYLSWCYALSNQGVHLSFDEYIPFIGKSAELSAEIHAKKMGKNCVKSLIEDKRVHFAQLQQGGFDPIAPTIEFIQRLAKRKEMGLKLGVASAARKEEIMNNLRHLKIESYFDVIVSGHEDLTEYNDPEGVNKPKPYIYEHAAKLLNIHPSLCAAVEDSDTGILSAINAGCVAIAVPNAYTKQQDLSKAHFIIESFTHVQVNAFLERRL